MKKIAIFQYDLGLGGIQKSLINLLNNLNLDEYEIVYIYLIKKIFIILKYQIKLILYIFRLFLQYIKLFHFQF